MRCVTVVCTLSAILFLAGCEKLTQGFSPDPKRGALVIKQSDENYSPDIFGDDVSRVVYPEQNWSPEASLWFYNTTQGSNLMPYDIFMHLERHDSDEKFKSNSNMQRYRYLTQEKTLGNPDGLPVGWVKNSYNLDSYVGFTCAACHTTQLNYKDTGIRIDGGPAMADIGKMLKELEHALATVYKEPTSDKYLRLQKSILGDSPSSSEKDEFFNKLEATYKKIKKYRHYNRPAVKFESNPNNEQMVDYGYARLDAFGRIFNRLFQNIPPEDADNYNPANAPVSYPYLWDTPQHDFVQWNGIVDNSDLGPLGRNVGEVLGVFASLDIDRKKRFGKERVIFHSSADTLNLARLENHIKKLWSPNWRDLAFFDPGAKHDPARPLPAINEALAAQGKQLFNEDYGCVACHQDISRTDENRKIISQFSSLEAVGTDPKMAHNAMTYCGKPGILDSENVALCANTPELKDQIQAGPMLQKSVQRMFISNIFHSPGLFIKDIGRTIYSIKTTLSGNEIKDTRKQVDFEDANNGYINAYKARPLNGVWATAPFLHNGSVPTLYDLLLPQCSQQDIESGKYNPADCRPNTFTVGSREFDAEKVGIVSKDRSQYPELFLFDTSIVGNHNTGHEYAAGNTKSPATMIKNADGSYTPETVNGVVVTEYKPPMNHDQRMAIIEYIKTL